MTSAPKLSPVQHTALMCGAEAFSMTGFAAYTTLLPVLQREWGFTNSEAGLVGGIYYAGYVAATPILTSLTDRVDARRVYVAACLISLAGAGGFAFFAQGLASALLFQTLIGIGLGGTYMPGLKMLADQLEAILAPLVFGMVLDLAGGNQSRAAWGLAFASIGIFGALSPLARWLYLRRAAA